MDTHTWKPVKCPGTPSNYERFVRALKTRQQGQTHFEGGAKIQAYLDASVRSAKQGGIFVPTG